MIIKHLIKLDLNILTSNRPITELVLLRLSESVVFELEIHHTKQEDNGEGHDDFEQKYNEDCEKLLDDLELFLA